MFTSVIFSKTLFDALQTIDLSDNNLTQVAGKILAKHLPKYPQLETLMYAISFSICFHQSTVRVYQLTYRTQCLSTECSLRNNKDLKDAGAKAVAEAILKHFRDVKSKADEASGALPNSVYMAFRLRTLDLSDCGLHDQAVGEALPALLRENVPLDTLVLSQNMDVLPEAWAEFAKALAKNEELTLLALDYCRLGDANFVSLVSKGESPHVVLTAGVLCHITS